MSRTLDDFDAPPPEGPDALDDVRARLKLTIADMDNAERLVRRYGRDMIFVPGRGWGVWSGAVYDFEHGIGQARRMAQVLREMVREELDILDELPVPAQKIAEKMAASGLEEEAAVRVIRQERRKSRAEGINSLGNRTKINAALELAEDRFRITAEALDADPTLLQLPNGTLDLSVIADRPSYAEDDAMRRERYAEALRPAERGHLPTKLMGCTFDAEASCPFFEDFVEKIMPSPEERRYLQRCCGMLLGGQRNEVVQIWTGQGGNGKSTLANAIELVMGSYAQPTRIELFVQTRQATGVTPEEAALPGARVYLASEPDDQITLSTSKIKGLTGGNRRQANPKNKDVFSWLPVGVPLLQVNKMPNVSDPSDGFWRRIYPIRFLQDLSKLTGNRAVSSDAARFYIQQELPGILNWMLAGYGDYRHEGLNPPEHVAAWKGDQRSLADPVGEFLSDWTSPQIGAECRTSELYKAFVAWSEAKGDKAMSAKRFTSEMLRLDYQRHKRSDWFWVNLDLLPGAPGQD